MGSPILSFSGSPILNCTDPAPPHSNLPCLEMPPPTSDPSSHFPFAARQNSFLYWWLYVWMQHQRCGSRSTFSPGATNMLYDTFVAWLLCQWRGNRVGSKNYGAYRRGNEIVDTSPLLDLFSFTVEGHVYVLSEF